MNKINDEVLKIIQRDISKLKTELALKNMELENKYVQLGRLLENMN